MVIIVFGLPCSKTERTIINVEEAVAEIDNKLKIRWVSEVAEMTKWGVISTPTVFVNERPRSEGRIPSVYEVKKWIQEEMREVRLSPKR